MDQTAEDSDDLETSKSITKDAANAEATAREAGEQKPADQERAVPNIRLDQFLQGCGVPTGGQAKRLIQAGEILVNDEVETRRRRKLVLGDEVLFEDEIYVVAMDEEE